MEKENTVIDGRVKAAIAGSRPGGSSSAIALSEKLAEGSVVARVRLGQARDTVLMTAIAKRLEAEPGLKALIVAPADRDVAGLKGAFDAIAGKGSLTCSTVGRDSAADESDAVIGSLDAIASRAASGSLDTGSFGLIALCDLDAMSDIANSAMLRRAIGTASPGRRIAAFSAELGPASLAIARDLAGTLVELELEAEGERVMHAPSVTYGVSADDKPRLLLGLLAASGQRPVAVFCDLRDTAEDAARRLRTSGIRTEYIVGNLPRKRAILDSVKAGAFEVLVMTDEGASGLPPAWAATVVNWDLPLESEPYLSRLAHLKQSGEGSRVYNFACERYSYGIPAIESAIGQSLAIVRAEEAMMAPKDSAADSSRLVSQRSDDDRGGQRRGDDHRDSRDSNRDSRDKGGQYDGRNARAIQADIAAITGGKPTASASASSAVSSTPASDGSPQEKAQKRRGRKSPSAGPRVSAPQAQSARTPRQEKVDGGSRREQQAQNRSPQPRHELKRGSRSKSGTTPRLTDPYSVSMEERLKLYRERYSSERGSDRGPSSGQARGSGTGQARGPGSAPARGSGTNPARGSGSGPARGGAKGPVRDPRQDTRRGQPAAQGKASVHGAKSAAKPTIPAAKAPKPASKGLFGALKDLFAKKDE